jgi:hypothetical protein
MAESARDVGHEWVALTDHSPRLTVASGLSAERLCAQVELVGRLNAQLAPFRILTGIEVDILDDGRLDQQEDLLAELDVVVASVHSKLRMSSQPMTDRMVAAMANPHTDVLGHCTGRLVLGKGRPESTFDADIVFGACAHFDKAVEINCRPERLDPPMRLLEQVLTGVHYAEEPLSRVTHMVSNVRLLDVRPSVEEAQEVTVWGHCAPWHFRLRHYLQQSSRRDIRVFLGFCQSENRTEQSRPKSDRTLLLSVACFDNDWFISFCPGVVRLLQPTLIEHSLKYSDDALFALPFAVLCDR